MTLKQRWVTYCFWLISLLHAPGLVYGQCPDRMVEDYFEVCVDECTTVRDHLRVNCGRRRIDREECEENDSADSKCCYDDTVPNVNWCFRNIADRRVDECVSNPCQNGGTCNDQINAYTCDCRPGIIGTNCEIDTCPDIQEPSNGYHVNPSSSYGHNYVLESECDPTFYAQGGPTTRTCTITGTPAAWSGTDIICVKSAWAGSSAGLVTFDGKMNIISGTGDISLVTSDTNTDHIEVQGRFIPSDPADTPGGIFPVLTAIAAKSALSPIIVVMISQSGILELYVDGVLQTATTVTGTGFTAEFTGSSWIITFEAGGDVCGSVVLIVELVGNHLSQRTIMDDCYADIITGAFGNKNGDASDDDGSEDFDTWIPTTPENLFDVPYDGSSDPTITTFTQSELENTVGGDVCNGNLICLLDLRATESIASAVDDVLMDVEATTQITPPDICEPLTSDATSEILFSTGTMEGDVHLVTCNVGFYHLSGDLERTCGSDGTWSGDAAVCESLEFAICSTVDTDDREDCGFPQITPEQCTTQEDSVCCFIPEPVAVITNHCFPRPTDVTCEDTSQNSFGDNSPARPDDSVSFFIITVHDTTDDVDDGIYQAGTIFVVICDEGYFPTGDLRRVCLADGEWSGTAANCRRICDPLSTPPNAEASPNRMHTALTFVEGDTFDVTCLTGFELDSGDNTRTCQSDGTWSGTVPVCTNIDDCTNGACNQNGDCIDGINGFICICDAQYTGTNCETEITPCSSEPCINGATCQEENGGYMCECVQGYEGINCEIDTDDCAPEPCENNGSCMDLLDGFECTCASGFDGNTCQNNIDECESSPCQNGGSCDDGVNMYSCDCPTGFIGNDCETDINHCEDSPCQNGGTCVDGVDEFTCDCVLGWTGSDCSEDIEECDSSPCQNDGVCDDLVNGYECNCVDGTEGTNCETDIDECASNPCQNEGDCEDKLNEYTCTCQPGFTGTQCETPMNACTENANICENGGTCTPSGAIDYSCTCLAGYTGDNCQTNIDECANDPCENGGACTDEIDAYTCTCPGGYTGLNCETDIDECSSQPCQNGGTCQNMVDQYTCDCPAGFTGVNCMTDEQCNLDNGQREDCGEPDITQADCESRGCCFDNTLPATLWCYNKDIDDCATNPCLNNGVCTDAVASFSCACVDGFSGDLCEILPGCNGVPADRIDCGFAGISEMQCLTNGSCCFDSSTSGVMWCFMNAQFFDECVSIPCLNGGTCTDEVVGQTYTCTCAPGWEGLTCDENIDECVSNPCQNSGQCVDGIDGYECMCPTGYTGSTCETDLVCVPDDPCLNEGICTEPVPPETGPDCACPDGYSGSTCELVDNCYFDNTCENGATCSTLVSGVLCACADGYTGSNCEIDIDECMSDPCQNGGTCLDDIDAYSCECAAGFEGDNCETDIDECLSDPCNNGGTCQDEVDSYSCECPLGFGGETCDQEMPCDPNPCENDGECSELPGGMGILCVCAPGFVGDQCQLNAPCINFNPCMNEGTCTPDGDAETCQCTDAFYGNRCQFAVICGTPADPCLNDAECTDTPAGPECECRPGYEGDICDMELRCVLDNPCENDAICHENEPPCTCFPPYTGMYCETEIDGCYSAVCYNGGTCNSLGTYDFECLCTPDYKGKQCHLIANACLLEPCQNDGLCIEMDTTYLCHCPAGYGGPHCEQAIDPCATTLCHNMGTCYDSGNGIGSCLCDLGFTGFYCENPIDLCASSPCLNGGQCQTMDYTYFQCICPGHYYGYRCERRAMACDSRPCGDNGDCVLTADYSYYSCICEDGYSGPRCTEEELPLPLKTIYIIAAVGGILLLILLALLLLCCRWCCAPGGCCRGFYLCCCGRSGFNDDDSSEKDTQYVFTPEYQVAGSQPNWPGRYQFDWNNTVSSSPVSMTKSNNVITLS